ncbi:MAG: hypothetical protein ACOX61_06350 [Brooklawnia sp.]|jgi:hypothetical protein
MGRWFACLSALALLVQLVGCGGPVTGLERQVDQVVTAAGHELITRMTISNDPAELQVVMRAPGGEVAHGPNGPVGTTPSQMPVGATRPDAIDYEGLEQLLAETSQECDAAWLEFYVTPSGAMVTQGRCGQDYRAAGLDLLSEAGIAQLLAEAEVMLPNRASYMLSLPGPASPRGAVARVEGRLWALADGTPCQTVLWRNAVPDAGNPPWTLDCQGRGMQSVNGESQELFAPGTVDAARVQSGLEQARQASGYAESEVEFYLYHQLFVHGEQIVVLGVDGGQFSYNLD